MLIRLTPLLSLSMAFNHQNNCILSPARKASFVGRGSNSQLSMAFDAGLAQSVVTAVALPVAFVGTGTFLLTNESEEDEYAESKEDEEKEVDIYRDTLLRYAGYANEVGEAFAPLVPAIVVPASYGVAITYVLADTVDKTRKALTGGKYGIKTTTSCALIEGLDALIWQLAASVALPGYTIHQVVAITVMLLNAAGITEDVNALFGVIPTAVGLITIPFIVKPLDEFAEVGMDVTLRKIWNPYLDSCTIDFGDDE